MHILDIVENSIRADSPVVTIEVNEDIANNILTFSIIDGGKGMPEQIFKNIKNPFVTSRKTRKVGLGVPMLDRTCILSGGDLFIQSEIGKGTVVKGYLEYYNINRPPIGDMAGTIFLLIIMHPQVDFKYIHKYNGKEYYLDTREIRNILDGISITEPIVMEWLKQTIKEGLKRIVL